MSNSKPINKKISKVKSRNTNPQQSKEESKNVNINLENLDIDNTAKKTETNHDESNMNHKASHDNKHSDINNKNETDKIYSKEEKVILEEKSNSMQTNETKVDQTNDLSVDYKKISEETQYKLDKLQILFTNSQLECNKLKMMLENERKQLIEKLEEKAKAAQLQVEQKLSHLELTKQQELEKMKENISSDIINAFIDPILLFESSIQNAPKDNPTISAYLQGYTMIINMFKDKLDSLGVQQIDVRVGDLFNEKFMSAFDVEEAPGVEPNKVIRVVGKGFVLNKKIIKYVSVVVSK